MRVLLKRDGQLALNRTWSIAPGNDVPWQGRAREALDDFVLPRFRVEQDGQHLQISTDRLQVTVHQPLCLSWEQFDGSDWQPLAADRHHTGAYLLNVHGDGVEHYQRRQPQDRVYGLGEKSGNLNRANRRFEIRNLDAMAYNAASTDPLYKHIPFTLTQRDGVNFGLFYDNLSGSWLDLGNETSWITTICLIVVIAPTRAILITYDARPDAA